MGYRDITPPPPPHGAPPPPPHGAPPPPPHGAPPPPPHGAPPPPPHGAPPPPPHGAPPPPPLEVEIFVNSEGERTAKEFAEIIKKIAEKLIEKGEVTISGYTVAPSERSWTVIRYERTPDGDYSLKMEIKWHPKGSELEIE